ncbi:erythromycin esterase family protein [Cryomorpha ignava]|uniref:Erythromycin esterase family protein n=1 Tax=Cryomorpha ignava TaxID=101383 RepID=A0A7K3WSF2_9FLAO|nr:erythromycin esterase family protein [Cryomorpha ignava]NEN23802.1 erythromycin esterase family protein [Cryomorpha ignava]
MKKFSLYFGVVFFLLINFLSFGYCQRGPINPILSIESNDFADLVFIDSLIANKSIVFLGESKHGVEDFNKMKFRIIRYLHEKHDFNLVVFEGSVHEVALTNILRDTLNSLEMLTQALMGYWRTESNCNMMKYLSENQIDIAGMDLVSHALPPKKEFYKIIYKDDILADKFFALDSLYNFKYRFERVNFYHNNRKTSIMGENLDSLAKHLIHNYEEAVNELKQIQIPNQKLLLWANNSLIRQIKEMNKINGGYFNLLSAWRDSSMASNLMYAMSTIYPNQKTIVWAYDGHISKNGNHQFLNSIGMYVDQTIKDQSVFIGLSAIDGTYSIGMNPPYPIKLKLKNIERKYKKIITKGVFVQATNLNLPGGMSFVGSIQSEDLQELFDGYIFLKDVRGSQLIKYNEPNNCK